MIMCKGNKRYTHEEIVYDTRSCPLCDSMKECDDIETKLIDTQEKIKELEDELKECPIHAMM